MSPPAWRNDPQRRKIREDAARAEIKVRQERERRAEEAEAKAPKKKGGK